MLFFQSNKKLELTEKLEVELHGKKALNKRISELEDKLNPKKYIFNHVI